MEFLYPYLIEAQLLKLTGGTFSSSGNSVANLVLLNSAFDQEWTRHLIEEVKKYFFVEPHIWISSSGSTASSEREIKIMALSKKALLAAAVAANAHLNAKATDRWLNILPLFHVGGLGVLFRAHLSGAEVINKWNSVYKWNPIVFCQDLDSHHITLTSLVPTQIFDLVKKAIVAPTQLRAVVVGGAALSEDLYHQARALGWPLLPSFGMTELCSQVATASLDSISDAQFPPSYPQFQLLNHIEARVDLAGILHLKSSSLMSGCLQIQGAESKFQYFGENSWYECQDRAKLEGRSLEVLGRKDEVIKILGENVNMAFLREKLGAHFANQQVNLLGAGQGCLVAFPEARAGNELTFIIESGCGTTSDEIYTLLRKFNSLVLPFERIHKVLEVERIPKSPLGKILVGQILKAKGLL